METNIIIVFILRSIAMSNVEGMKWHMYLSTPEYRSVRVTGARGEKVEEVMNNQVAYPHCTFLARRVDKAALGGGPELIKTA